MQSPRPSLSAFILKELNWERSGFETTRAQPDDQDSEPRPVHARAKYNSLQLQAECPLRMLIYINFTSFTVAENAYSRADVDRDRSGLAIM